MTPEQAQADTRRRLNDIAHAVEERLPEGFGFMIMVFPFEGTKAEQPPGRQGQPMLNYVSNAKREQVINLMKEWLIKCGAAEDWMKHIK